MAHKTKQVAKKKSVAAAPKRVAAKASAAKRGTAKAAGRAPVAKSRGAAKKAAPKAAAKKLVKKPAAKQNALKKAAPKKVAKKPAPAKKKAAPKKVAKKSAPAKKKVATKKKVVAKKAVKKAPAKAAKAAKVKAVKPVKPAPLPVIETRVAPVRLLEGVTPPTKHHGPALAPSTLEKLRLQLIDERERFSRQAEALIAEAEEIASEREPGDTQFDEESGEGDTLTIERERDLALSATALQTVDDIDKALERIAKGSYGYCEMCGDRIVVARLEVIPWADLCVKCKSRGERRR